MKVLKRRRLMAFIIDIYASLSISLLINGIIGIFRPLDVTENIHNSFWVTTLISSIYLVILPIYLKTSLGRFICSYHITSVDNSKISIFKRQLVLYLIWPFNALFVFFSENGNHIADNISKTNIELNEKTRSSWIGFVGLVSVIFISMSFSMYGIRLGMKNSKSHLAALEYIEKNYPNFQPSSLPSSFQIKNDNAVYYIEGKNEVMYLRLSKIDDRWIVQSSEILK